MNLFTTREKRLCAILCNAIIIALELVGGIINTINSVAAGNGWKQFQYYTQDSNYFAMIVSILFLIWALRKKKDEPLPDWLLVLRYIATCLLSVTFLVIVFILCPPYGWEGYRYALLSDAKVFEHLLCPILSFVSLLLFEDTPKQAGAPFLAMIPTFLYAAVAVSLNFANVWHGPYPFLYVYEQPWWQSVLYAIVIPLGALMVAFFLLFALKKRKAKE